ncbi:MAG: VWA-like domain-containing protein [Desulfovibrio sp.]|nr:VWA-like domain-containing protein [Desulfovibrio sp.]
MSSCRTEQKGGGEGLRDASFAMSRARTDLVCEHPFFGTMVLRLSFVEDPDCRDLWCDGKNLAYNPHWVLAQNRETLKAAQAHEMLHLALGHHVRRHGRDARLWNRACDFAVNLLLREAGFSIPGSFEFDDRYKDMDADAIFLLLSSLLDEVPNGGAKNASKEERTKNVSGGGADLGGGQGGRSKEDGPLRAAEGKSGGIGRQARGHSGQEGEEQAESLGDAFIGEVRDHPSLSENIDERQGRRFAEREAKVSLMMAMQRALHQGDMPGCFTRLLKKTVHPGLDWKARLQRFLEMCVDNDSTWTHPNRRYLYQNIYLPSRSEPNIPPFCVAIDCSGSVDEEKLALFCAELSSVLETYDSKVTVIFHDSEVQDHRTFVRSDLPLCLSPKGGGGTDYRPVCEWIEHEALRPVCLLWFTDLECSSFPGEPEYPVLWISSGRNEQAPPFGEWVVMNTA